MLAIPSAPPSPNLPLRYDLLGLAGYKELSFIKCVSVSAALLAFTMDASALTFETAPLDGSATAIIVSGVFSPSENLSEFTSKISSIGGKSIIVIFKSPGGNPSTATRLGRLIRAMDLPVIQPREMQCESMHLHAITSTSGSFVYTIIQEGVDFACSATNSAKSV